MLRSGVFCFIQRIKAPCLMRPLRIADIAFMRTQEAFAFRVLHDELDFVIKRQHDFA